MLTQLIIIQPIDLCNLNCSYCYLPGRRDPSKMSYETLENTIKCIFNSTCVSNKVTLVFHAGEPLAAGLKWYEDAMYLIKKHNNKGLRLDLSIQTNGTLLNDEWCTFFKMHDIDVSISLDGPKFINDESRVDWKNKGSFDRILKGVKCLKKNNIPLSAICVLTENSLNYPIEIYNFFVQHGFEALSLNIEEIECFNEQSTFCAQGEKLDETKRAKYKLFMSTLYDQWILDNKKIGYIREFSRVEEMLKKKVEHNNALFTSTEVVPFGIISITKSGAISTFSPELSGGTKTNKAAFYVGNVNVVDSFEETCHLPIFISMAKQIQKGTQLCAQKCEYYGVCGGGSPSNKFYENGSFESTETSFCLMSKKDMVDLIVEKRKVGYLYSRLQKGITLISNLPLKNRLEINDGTDYCTENQKFIRQHSAKTAYFPNESWRNLLDGEYHKLMQPQKNIRSDTHIYLSKLPEKLYQSILDLKVNLLSSEAECNQFLKTGCYSSLTDMLLGYFSDYLKNGYHWDSVFIRPMTCNQPGRTTMDIVNKEFSGMHVDRWDKNLLLDELPKARTRIVINLGSEERYFVFVNLTHHQIYTALYLNSEHRKHHGAVDFFEKFPKYPILKLKIKPGEYYIAPVGNLLHDGYTLSKSKPDTSISLIGHFDFNKLNI